MMLRALYVFLVMVALDVVWARYTVSLMQVLPFPAACYSAGIILLGGFGIIEYTANPWLIVPAAAGAFAGTYLSTALEKHKCRSKKS